MGTEETKKKKKRRKFKHWKLVIFLVIIIALVIWLVAKTKEASSNAYIREEVQVRDIKTYHSFSGVVEPVDIKNVSPELTGVKITEILVEEGDEVKEGDVLMYLDRESIEKQIEEMETSRGVSEANSNMSVRQAYNNYITYKNNYENGLNSQIVAAKQQVANAEQSMTTAADNYVREVSMNQAGLGTYTMNSQSTIDNAYVAVRNAQIALESADHAVRNAASDEARFQAGQQYEQAERSLESAWINYNNALSSRDAAEKNEENSINNYYNQYVNAQTAYLNAVDNLAVTQKAVEDTIASYRLQYEQALTSSDTSVSDLQLARLYEQIDDCTIRANMDGIVTKINVREGDYTTNAMQVVTITSFDTMQISIKINEYDLLGAEVGEKVEITLNALDKDYEGTISEISRMATVQNGVSFFEATVEFEADEDVRSGMSVEVRLITNECTDILTVPTKFINTREDGTAYVQMFDESGKIPVEVDVVCGVTDGTYTEIKEGVSEGDVVLTLPLTLEELQMQMMMGE